MKLIDPAAKTNWKFIAIVLVFGLAIGGGMLAQKYFGFSFKTLKTPEEQVQNETANWQTYRNEEFEFEARYPEGWEAEITQIGTVRIKNLASNSSLEIIENKNTEGISLDEWFRKTTIINGRPTLGASAQSITINGVKAYRLNSDLQPPNPLFYIVGIANAKKRIFSIYAYSEQESDNNILNQMLSTFRFLK